MRAAQPWRCRRLRRAGGHGPGRGYCADEIRRSALAYAFFAEGNDPNVWPGGWHTSLAIAQDGADTVEVNQRWRAGGGIVPMHVIQAASDVVSPPGVGSALLAADFPDRVFVTVVEKAGHALLPEQPEAVAEAVLRFLAKVGHTAPG